MTNVGIILKNRRLVNILFRFFAEIRSLRLDDQVDELILDENDLDDLHPVERLGDLLDLTGVTRIIVTHALEETLLRRYDRIYVLKDGRIDEAGKFEELMEKKGYFYALYTVSQ